MALIVKTQPLTEPLDIDDVKLHLRVDSSDEDTLIALYMKTAREHCQNFQNRSYINTIYELWLDEFPCKDYIELPMPPLVSVASLDIYDTSDVKTADAALTDYYQDTKSEPGKLCLNYGKTWPSTTLRPTNGVCVTFTGGYGTSATLTPSVVKQAMLLLIGDYYQAREAGQASDTTITAVERLLWLQRNF